MNIFYIYQFGEIMETSINPRPCRAGLVKSGVNSKNLFAGQGVHKPSKDEVDSIVS